jgi:cellulose synthase catalytic subunit (UDP-forming)
MDLDPSSKRTGTLARILTALVLCVTAFLFFQLISLYLSWQKQAILGAVALAVGVGLNRASRSRIVTLVLMLVSVMATFRYGWWRVHTLMDYFRDQSNRHISLDAALMLLLISAEAYTVVIMLLGYMQTAWPLQRRPIPMPPDESQWPDVDVYIPTYNEPLSLVRYTALAAINIDYPSEKLHIYILDDGTREDFKLFCAEAGVGYITRPTHPHAKAGNINHAMEMTHSPFVAIFDCDHVPTRSFLQVTMGWMMADRKLAMLQTPHHFYSPDPFERNLLQYKTIPNEGELFYGIIQDGNDFWNATFFCGSCALIRRSALDEIGGIATETVTEDAHTSLRLQRRGYNTAYINIPQAAGLATETLAAHVGQRVRWARGMIQILRTDNPLFGPGLKLSQRLCYFNAMAHFMYSVPRLVFLLAPLAYLLLGRTIIPGYWVAIVAYALPHLFMASLTNSRVQSYHRHSFWNEIYESVLAPYILLPTVLALINPKLGKFNVTAKGNTLSETQFDRRISAPTRWMLLFNFAGLAVVPYKLLVSDPQHPGAVCMNLLWVLFNIVILGVAAAVAYEQKQRRESVRIEVRIGVRVELPDGRIFDGETTDMSVGGASIRLNEELKIRPGSIFAVSFPHVSGEEQVRARVAGTSGDMVRVAYLAPSIVEQETLARTLYSRADAWIVSPGAREEDRPLVSLGRVMVLSGRGLYQIFRSMLPEKRRARQAVPAQTTAAALLLALALGSGLQARAAQAPARAAAPAAPEDSGTDLSTARQLLSFRDLGLESPIEMRGPHSYYSLHFTISHALVAKQATLNLLYTLDPTLNPRTTLLRVSVNGIAVTTLAPHPDQAPGSLSTAALSLPEWALVRNNTLTFEFVGAMPSSAQGSDRVFCRIFPESKLELSGARLRLEDDLGKLPLPILDSGLESETVIPFVFLEPPDRAMLQAAGIVASWFGIEAGVRPPRFVVSLAAIPAGNAVLFLNRRALLPSDISLPASQGPLIALRPNPSDPFGTLLIVAGNDDAQLVSAASSLALTGKAAAAVRGGSPAWHGDTALLSALALPPARGKDDAPRWMQAGKVNALASCQAPDQLQTDGSNPVRAYFHVPPDLFYGEEQTVDLHLNYRYDARQVAAGSALRTYVNGSLVNEIPLPPGVRTTNGQRLILVPVAALRPFGNTIQFNFDFVAANRDPSESSQLSGSIQCDSTLDLRDMKLWTEMPNLELFANAGFPFTQRADLNQTTIVLPSDPSVGEIMLYLQLMGHFGGQTGYPALRFALADPAAEIQEGRDYLVLGALGNQPAFRALDLLLPVTFDKAGLRVKPRSGLFSSVASVEDTAWRWGDDLLHIRRRDVTAPLSATTADAMVEEVRSPVSPDRSIVVVEMASDGAEAGFAQALAERSQSADMSGSLSLLRNARFASYSLDQPAYHVGNISWYATMRIYLAQHFLFLLLAVTGLCFLVARLIYEWMAAHARQRLSLGE